MSPAPRRDRPGDITAAPCVGRVLGDLAALYPEERVVEGARVARELREAATAVTWMRAAAVTELQAAGLSVADIGDLVGLRDVSVLDLLKRYRAAGHVVHGPAQEVAAAVRRRARAALDAQRAALTEPPRSHARRAAARRAVAGRAAHREGSEADA